MSNEQDPNTQGGTSQETQIPHSGRHHGERPVREFDKTPLRDAVEQGLVDPLPPHVPSTLEPGAERPMSAPQDRDPAKEKVMGARSARRIVGGITAGAALLAGGVVAGVNLADRDESRDNNPSASGPAVPGQNETESEHPLLERIGDKSDFRVGEVEALARLFNNDGGAGPATVEGLTAALSQASQEEIDTIRAVLDDYDGLNDNEVTHIIQKYGLDTNEIPYDPLARISELNNMGQDEIHAVNDLFNTRSYGDVRAALAQCTQEEIDVIRDVVDGYESTKVAARILNQYGFNDTTWASIP